MNDDVKKRSEEVALFRFGVIGDLVHLPPGAKGLYERFKEKADIDYRIPGSPRVRVAPETIRSWLRAYRKGGLDALHPRVRADHGQSHALPREVSDLLIAIKDDKRDLSVQLVIREALASGKVPEGLPLAPSTVHRLLSRGGLMAKEPDAPTSKPLAAPAPAPARAARRAAGLAPVGPRPRALAPGASLTPPPPQDPPPESPNREAVTSGAVKCRDERAVGRRGARARERAAQGPSGKRSPWSSIVGRAAKRVGQAAPQQLSHRVRRGG